MGTSQSSIRPRRTFLRSGLALAPVALATSLLRGQKQAVQDQINNATLVAQQLGDPPPETRMPNGQTQTDAILKADYDQNVKDARELTALARAIELDFDKNDQNVLSLSLLKKLDDVEKITKRIRARVHR
jgi:hypothetical protein